MVRRTRNPCPSQSRAFFIFKCFLGGLRAPNQRNFVRHPSGPLSMNGGRLGRGDAVGVEWPEAWYAAQLPPGHRAHPSEEGLHVVSGLTWKELTSRVFTVRSRGPRKCLSRDPGVGGVFLQNLNKNKSRKGNFSVLPGSLTPDASPPPSLLVPLPPHVFCLSGVRVVFNSFMGV